MKRGRGRPRSRCDHDVLTTYRVLSAASGREVASIQSLCAALGLWPRSLLRYLARLGLKTAPLGGSRRAAAPGLSSKNGRAVLRAVPCRPRGLKLEVLRTARVLEACSGRGANHVVVARVCGISKQRVHKILAEAQAPWTSFLAPLPPRRW